MSNAKTAGFLSPMDLSTTDGWLHPVPHEAPAVQPSPDGVYFLEPFRHGGMWTLVTPSAQYRGLPDRDLEDNALVAGIDLTLDRMEAACGSLRLRISDQAPDDQWLGVLAGADHRESPL